MTIAERNNKLKHFITCLKCDVSGKPCDVNCPTQYDAGNMGEIIENLEVISKALEQEPKTGHWIGVNPMVDTLMCSECGENIISEDFKSNYCPNCGAKMVEPQESDHKCYTCKHYTSGENDGSCGSYICKGHSNWERKEQE